MTPPKPKDPAVKTAEIIADAIRGNFTSPNCCDANGEAANVVDGLYAVADAIRYAADRLANVLESRGS